MAGDNVQNILRHRNFSSRKMDDTNEKGALVELHPMSEPHDERTQVEAAQRDPSRFADLYERNFYRVYAYIVRRVGDRHQAEDLTADVFREALAGLAKFEWRGAPF